MKKLDKNSIEFIEQYRNYSAKKNEEYMCDAQLQHFYEKLMAWKQLLMQSVASTVKHLQDGSSIPADPNDRATQEEEFAIELRTRDRERKLVQKIEKALLRIKNGEYGYCQMTGEEIGLARLEARPTAVLCLDAKEKQEKKEKLGV